MSILQGKGYVQSELLKWLSQEWHRRHCGQFHCPFFFALSFPGSTWRRWCWPRGTCPERGRSTDVSTYEYAGYRQAELLMMNHYRSGTGDSITKRHRRVRVALSQPSSDVSTHQCAVPMQAERLTTDRHRYSIGNSISNPIVFPGSRSPSHDSAPWIDYGSVSGIEDADDTAM